MSNVFLRAMQYIAMTEKEYQEAFEGCRGALYYAGAGIADYKAFAEVFGPKGGADTYWWPYIGRIQPRYQHRRLIALGLAAAMRETGDL